MKNLLSYITDTLEKLNFRHEVHSFESGAIMVDIWVDDKSYVVQINGDSIGLSLVSKDSGFAVVPEHSFTDASEFKRAFEKIFPWNTSKKILTINGDNFSTLEGFYTEIDKVLTKNLDWKTGHNLDAFNDLLRGGFGVHEYEEPIRLVWFNSDKSKSELGRFNKKQSLYEILLDIISDHQHIEFIEC